jgi:hypothetical protein
MSMTFLVEIEANLYTSAAHALSPEDAQAIAIPRCWVLMFGKVDFGN